MKDTIRFKSAVDVRIVLVLVGAPALLVGLGVLAFSSSPGAAAFQIAFGLVVAALIAALTLPCYYDLTASELSICCGYFEYCAPLDRIQRVELTSSLWSGAALSLNRIRIVMDDGQCHLISPKDRPEFIRQLEERAGRTLK